MIFLSTLPARGATGISVENVYIGNISIHAPREGSDCRLPSFCVLPLCISIHAPREGGDGRRTAAGRPSLISIHAPREGSDLRKFVSASVAALFLSTLPARGATYFRGDTP